MSSDVELIVNAIEGLHTNIIKDYILPVGSILFSGALGVGGSLLFCRKARENEN